MSKDWLFLCKSSSPHYYDYIAYIEDAYLSFTVPPYSESIRKVHSNPKKIYSIDPGISHAVTMQISNSY